MRKYLDKTGLQYFYGKLKEKFADKTTIENKLDSLTGALTWKGKFDTLPAVTNYEAGNVIGVGNKEYVLTITGSTKAWEELGDEGSYLLKSAAEETYLKKAAGEVKSTNLANNAVTKEKLSTDVQSSLDKADNSLQKGNVAAPTSDTDAVNKSYVDGKTENLITNDDSLNLNVPIIIYTSTDDDSIAANKASISFYLKFWEKYTLRITDTTFGDTNIRRPSNTCFIPTILSVSKSNNIALGTGIIFGYIGDPDISYYHGIFRATSMSDSTHDGSYKIVSINANTGKLESASQLISANISYSKFNTTAKDIFGAINEVNTLAKSKGNGTITEVKMNGASKGTSGVVDLGTVLTAHQDISGKVDKTLNAKAFEGITIQTSNTTEAMNANKAAIQAYANNLIELGVDITKGFNVPVITDNSFYGCLTGRYIAGVEGYFLSGSIFFVGGTNYIKDIYIGPPGRYIESVNIQNDNDLNTTSKDLIGAINEVNTLAKNKQDKLTSGTNIKTINNQSLLGSGNIKISAPSITVDTSMSDTSTNPVQNKVIKAYIDGLVRNVAAWIEYE